MLGITIILATVLLLGVAMVMRYNETEKRNILFGGREFNVYCESQYGGTLCSVTIYEVVHPNRKFFREKYRTSKSFWISDYNTIKQGLYAMIEAYTKDEEEAERISNKWKELDNGN